MKQIDLENWEQSPDNPQKSVYAGQRTAQEVFAEIKYRLESVGMLPDKYFLIDREWENGREIPKDAVIFSTVQYGASEGIYLDVSITWDEEDKKNIKCFATGKTLGESESHLDRMYLTASAINKALNGIFKTDATGTITIPHLPKNSYVVQEIKAPTDYILENQTQTIAIDYGKTYSLDFYNKK